MLDFVVVDTGNGYIGCKTDKFKENDYRLVPTETLFGDRDEFEIRFRGGKLVFKKHNIFKFCWELII